MDLADVAALVASAASLLTAIVALLRQRHASRRDRSEVARVVKGLVRERDELRRRCGALESDLALFKAAAEDSGLFRILRSSGRDVPN